jgi:hypothetical protein
MVVISRADACRRAAWLRHLVIAALLLPIAACKVGPDFTTPTAPVADKWLEADNVSVISNRQDYALILAIGLVVDDAIVIVEGVSKYIEQGTQCGYESLNPSSSEISCSVALNTSMSARNARTLASSPVWCG